MDPRFRLSADFRSDGCHASAYQVVGQAPTPQTRGVSSSASQLQPTNIPSGRPTLAFRQRHWTARADEQQGLWQQLKLALQPMQEDKIVELVSQLEGHGHISEGSFAWFAADLAMQACHGDDPILAKSAIEDVLANLGKPCRQRTFRVTSANITVWRKDIANWMTEQQLMFLCSRKHTCQKEKSNRLPMM